MSAPSDSVKKAALDALNRHFLITHPAQAADFVDGFAKGAAIELFTEHQADVLAAVWWHLSPARINEIVPAIPEKLLREVLHALDPSVLAVSLPRISNEARERCLALLPRRIAAEVRGLMDYPAGSAGRVMDSRVPRFRGEQTAGFTLDQLRISKPRDLRCLFVVDTERRLTGIVDMQDLMIADSTDLLNEIARPPSATASPFDDREQLADQLRNLHSDVPVIDINGRLIGAIGHGALLRTLEEQASVDIQVMVGAGRDERALSTPQFAVRKRLPWLSINLMSACMVASVVALFESTIARFTVLAVLMPVVAGQSGNTGAQALAVTMRGLALREISTRQWFRVLFKEIRVGVINGIAVAFTAGLVVFLWSRTTGLALVISIAVFVSMVMASIAGAVIPIAFTRLGRDPAQSSTIVLTAVTDLTGFMSFLGIATLLANLL